MDKLIESISVYADNPHMDAVVLADYSKVVSQLKEFRWADSASEAGMACRWGLCVCSRIGRARVLRLSLI